MGKFQGVLLVSDYDNTLVYTYEALRTGTPVPSLSEENRTALEYFISEGGRFTIATGRALAAFGPCMEQVPMNAPAVICNGAAMYDAAKGAYLESVNLDGSIRERGQQVLDRFPSVAVEVYHLDCTIHSVHPNEVTRQNEELMHMPITELPSLPEVPLPVGKLLFEGEYETLKDVRAYLEAQGWDKTCELSLSTGNFLEVTAKNVDKGAMVRRLAERLGISLDRVYCAGDEANDISMLTLAAEGFAPANCAPAVRECGAAIVSDAREDALVDIVQILDKRYS
jgi:hypothetical protein